MAGAVETTLEMLLQEADKLSRRAIHEDRPDLINSVGDLVVTASRLVRAFHIKTVVVPENYLPDLKKRFLLATTLPVIPGLFTEDAVAAPIDPEPLRPGSTVRLGVGLAEYARSKEAIQAPRYHPERPYFGLVIPRNPSEDWFVIREKGDVSFVMLLEHEWVRNFGSDMVVVKEVLGLGREALKMACETYPDLLEYRERALTAFKAYYDSLSSEQAAPGIPGFYHFARKGFCRHPWDRTNEP